MSLSKVKTNGVLIASNIPFSSHLRFHRAISCQSEVPKDSIEKAVERMLKFARCAQLKCHRDQKERLSCVCSTRKMPASCQQIGTLVVSFEGFCRMFPFLNLFLLVCRGLGPL